MASSILDVNSFSFTAGEFRRIKRELSSLILVCDGPKVVDARPWRVRGFLIFHFCPERRKSQNKMMGNSTTRYTLAATEPARDNARDNCLCSVSPTPARTLSWLELLLRLGFKPFDQVLYPTSDIRQLTFHRLHSDGQQPTFRFTGFDRPRSCSLPYTYYCTCYCNLYQQQSTRSAGS
jgi:hypothetical protein